MSWKLMPMSPPQWGIGLELKISRLLRRKSRIQAGSFFISEISLTICRVEPLAGLEDVFLLGAEIVLVDFADRSEASFFKSVAIAYGLTLVGYEM